MAYDVAINLETEQYIEKHKTLTFKYVWNKSLLLEQWLLARNETPRRRVFQSYYGTAAGYEAFKELVAQVETHCGQWNVDCTAMLCPALLYVEGALCRISWPNGKKSEGFIERRGRVIKYHSIIKDGNRAGGKIDPWHFDGATVEVISRDAVRTVNEFPAWLRVD